jgi:hypothetical protein
LTVDGAPRASTNWFEWGAWSFKLRGDELTEISHCGNPILRAIRAVVRNHNWLTLTPEVVALTHTSSQDSLSVRLEIHWTGFGAVYCGELDVRLDRGGITVEYRGVAENDFLANRIGLIVLHYPDDAGQSVTVTSPAGLVTESTFPRWISPHQPFKDIEKFIWKRGEGTYRLDFTGDTFEMEDQRNWTDASFKTYSTPLSKPFPVLHRQGDTVSQRVNLTGRLDMHVSNEIVGQIPEIGTSIDPRYSMPGEALLTTAAFSCLLAEVAVDPEPADATISVQDAVATAIAVGSDLDLRMIASNAGEIAKMLDEVPPSRIRRLAVFSEDDHVTGVTEWDALASELEGRGFTGELLAGARSHFTELNRNSHRIPKDADALTYSITPQMHATEPAAIFETLAMQRLTAKQALRIGQGKPLHIGPLTIAPRFNAVATTRPSPDEGKPAEAAEDFTAAWVVGSIAALAIPGVASLSYLTNATQATAVQSILQQLAGLRGHEVLQSVDGTAPVALVPIRVPQGVLCLAANLTAHTLDLRVHGPMGKHEDLTLEPWATHSMVLN